MLLFGRNMLSKRLTAEDAGPGQPSAIDLVSSYGLADKWHRLQVPRGSPLIGRSVAQMQSLDRLGLVPVGFEKHQHGRPRLLRATPETVFEADDTIFVIGTEDQARQLVAAQDLVVLAPLDQRQRHEAFQPLDFGDTLLVAGGWAEIGRLREDRENFFVLTLPAEFDELMPARRRAPVAVGILVAMVVVMALEVIPNAAAVLLAALALITTCCVKLDAIYRIISWKTVILVAGTLPLATALAKTGATAMMANGMVAALGSLGPLAVLATLFLVTSLVGLFISNSATAVLMAPIAIEAARALHDSPQAFAMTVALGCCAAYVTPVSSAVNMLVMEPGGYTFGDYVKVGVPLLLLTMVITVVLVSVIYRF